MACEVHVTMSTKLIWDRLKLLAGCLCERDFFYIAANLQLFFLFRARLLFITVFFFYEMLLTFLLSF